jgi:hypothetical protein
VRAAAARRARSAGGVAPRRCATRDRVEDCCGLKSPERELRHVGDTLSSELVDQGVIGPMGEVVVVLDAGDLADLAPLRDLRPRDVAEADVPDQALLLQLRQRGKRLLDEPSAGPWGSNMARRFTASRTSRARWRRLPHRPDEPFAGEGSSQEPSGPRRAPW